MEEVSTPAFLDKLPIIFHSRDKLLGFISRLATVRFNSRTYCLLDGCGHLV